MCLSHHVFMSSSDKTYSQHEGVQQKRHRGHDQTGEGEDEPAWPASPSRSSARSSSSARSEVVVHARAACSSMTSPAPAAGEPAKSARASRPAT